MLYLILLLAAILFAGVAMTVNEGLWSNSVLFLCTLISSLFGLFMGLYIGFICLQQFTVDPKYYWCFLFAGIWLMFFVAILVLRLVTDKLSKVRMKFFPPIEMVGGPLMGLFVAVLFTSFAACTLMIPILGQQWKPEAQWQATTYKYAITPYGNVVRAYAEASGGDQQIGLFRKGAR